MFDQLNISLLAILAPPVLLSLTCHEYAHGFIAYKLGDDTAYRQGRLSFNPLIHLSLLGTLTLLLTSFVGWAKPVPISPEKFRTPKKDMALVALAGPVANLLVGLGMVILFKICFYTGLFAMLPKPVSEPLHLMIILAYRINIGLAIFNLLPFPPLDGFHLLSYFLPSQLSEAINSRGSWSFIILIFLLAIGAVDKIINPIIIFITELFW